MILMDLLILTWLSCALVVLLFGIQLGVSVATDGPTTVLARVGFGALTLLLGYGFLYWSEMALDATADEPGLTAYLVLATATLLAASVFDHVRRSEREEAANAVEATFDRPRFTRRTIS
jgi:hypothetical protein